MFAAIPSLLASNSLLEDPLARILVLVMLFVVGTMLGSFANVVVYRLPRHESLLWPPSHCPSCGKNIRWYDNVPILGWVLLRGKCRDCATLISTRYLFVETLFGILLATIGWLEIVERQANLPARISATLDEWPSVSVLVAYHMLLVGMLICAALIEQEGSRIPQRLPWFACCWGLVLPLWWNALRPVPLTPRLPHLLEVSSTLLGLAEGIAGVGVGLLMAALAWPMLRVPGPHRKNRWAIASSLATVGAFLGWQAVASIAAIVVVCVVLSTLFGRRWPAAAEISWSSWLAATTFVWISLWSSLVCAVPACGVMAASSTILIAGGLVALCSLAEWRMRPPTPATA